MTTNYLPLIAQSMLHGFLIALAAFFQAIATHPWLIAVIVAVVVLSIVSPTTSRRRRRY